jgi:hypothetical protein
MICLTYEVNENWLRTGAGEMFDTKTALKGPFKTSLKMTVTEFDDIGLQNTFLISVFLEF